MPNRFENFTNRLLDPGDISDENVRRNREMSQQLLRQTSTPRNIQHPTQGLALLMNALNARIFSERAGRGETALKQQKATQMGDLLNNLNLGPEQRALFESLPEDARQQIAVEGAARQLLPTKSKVERVGQRVVTLPNQPPFEAEIFRDTDANQLFIKSGDQRIPLDSRQLTTPTERSQVTTFEGKTDTQKGKDIVDFQDAAIGGLSAIQTGAELLQIAADTPEALGAPGTIVRAGNEFVRTAEALGSLMGVEVGSDRNVDDFTFDGFSGRLRETAVESQAFRSGIYGIAFAAAVAEQGTRPTDKDIQAFIDQIAGSTADPVAFRRTISTFVNRINRRLRSTAKIKGLPEGQTRAAFSELDAALEQFGASGRSPVELLDGFEDLSPEEQQELREAIRRDPSLLEGL